MREEHSSPTSSLTDERHDTVSGMGHEMKKGSLVL